MYSKPFIRDARDEDYPYLLEHFREEDRSYLPDTDFQEAVERSIFFKVVEWRGNPIAIYGVQASGYEGVGYPWFLSTPDIVHIAKSFMKQAPEEVAKMQEYFPYLENGISTDNKQYIKWLKRLGFQFGPDHGTGTIAFGRHN